MLAGVTFCDRKIAGLRHGAGQHVRFALQSVAEPRLRRRGADDEPVTGEELREDRLVVCGLAVPLGHEDERERAARRRVRAP